MVQKINFNKIGFVHMIGIKGIGMTALAACLKDRGVKISGSDVPKTFVTDKTLKKMGLSWWESFSASHITNQDLVIATGSAHQGPDNIEAIAAKKRGIPYLTHGEALGALMEKKRSISVCGVGGKTTTSAMLSFLMSQVGLNPSFVVGAGEIFPLGLPGGFNQRGSFFVAEADEYVTAKNFDHRPRFHWQNPEIVICTNIEHDHPDVYSNLSATKKTFQDFFKKIPEKGFLIINGDNKNNLATILGLKKTIITYGEKKENDYQIIKINQSPKKNSFYLQYNKEELGPFILKIPGVHNIFNATAAIITLKQLGVSLKEIKPHLSSFAGTKRRFEFLGKIGNRQIWDDYAHHPKQITATLSAARAWFGKKKILVLFQPHTFSRTQKLLAEFAQSLSCADQIFILPVYAAGRETGNPDKISLELTEKIKQKQKKATFVPNKSFLEKEIKKTNQEIIITMGAGDIWQIGQELLIQND